MKTLSLTAALLLSASPIWALTPQDVLEDWQGLAGEYYLGFTFTRQENSAEGITLYDVAISSGLSPVLPWIKLTKGQNGEVIITSAEAIEWDTNYAESVFTNTGSIAFEGLLLEATGSSGDIRYQVALKRFALETHLASTSYSMSKSQSLTGLSGMFRRPNSAESANTISIQFTVESWQSEDISKMGDAAPYTQQMHVENLAVEGEGNIAVRESGWFHASAENVVQSLKDARLGGMDSHIGAVEFLVNTGPDAPEVLLDLSDFSVAMRSPNPAMPSFAFAANSARINAAVHGRVEGATYPWQLDAHLQNLVLSPDTWAEIDPSGAMPHNPSHVQAQISGTGQVPTAQTDPFSIALLLMSEVKTLNLEQLDASFGSLALLANGSVTYGESRSPFGLPSLNGGHVDLRMQGAQTLLDTLSAEASVGIPTAELAGIMEGAAPSGQSPNDLNLRIDFQPDGSVSYVPLAD